MLKNLKLAAKQYLRGFGYDIVYYQKTSTPIAAGALKVRDEFKHLVLADLAIQKLLDEFTFETVLDVGCGAGLHADVFMAHGKKVTAVDYGRSIYFQQNSGRLDTIICDFNQHEFDQQYDCVWASHVLEHQVNPGMFLKKVFSVTRTGGVVCISVPPHQPEILGGHVSFWNGGLLLYQMVLAGFDCHNAKLLRYGYNISVIVQKVPATLPDLAFDNGDVNRISQFLPGNFAEGFNGEISSWNW